jgi:putative NADH-flavin reductase
VTPEKSHEGKQMKITVFGATGNIGGHVVRQTLSAGHKVTAVVRRSATFTIDHPALDVATVPGLTDCGTLRTIVEGSDAVISGVGPRGRKDGPVASTATRAILRAMEATGVRRIVAVSAAPVGPVPEGDSFLNRRLILPLIGAILRDAYIDLAAMEEEMRRSDTDWTAMRPPKLVNKALTGQYRIVVGANVPRGYSISRADREPHSPRSWSAQPHSPTSGSEQPRGSPPAAPGSHALPT